MSEVTREQVLERVAGLGPLHNVFLVGEGNEDFGTIVIWCPELGLRGLIIEKDDLARAVVAFLRQTGVRRFKSLGDLREAQRTEKWEGWDTCEDHRRMQRALAELAKRRKP